MSGIRAFLNLLWAHRRYWKGPIIVMLVVIVTLFAIAMAARIIPLIHEML